MERAMMSPLLEVTKRTNESETDGSFGLSPPHDGSEFQLFPELTVTMSEDCDSDLEGVTETEGKTDVKSPVIKIKMDPNEEQDFIKYLSNQTNTGNTPCLQVIRENNTTKIVVPKTTIVSPVGGLIKNAQNTKFVSYPNDPALSKNAIAARENRQRKKVYMEGLEQTVKELTTENETLKKQNETKDKAVEVLMNEVKYLRGVLANESSLSSLLRNIHSTQGVKFASKLPLVESTKESDQEKNNNKQPIKRRACQGPETEKTSKISKQDHTLSALTKESSVITSSKGSVITYGEENAGICLHVSNGAVSLELCASCCQKAKQSFRK